MIKNTATPGGKCCFSCRWRVARRLVEFAEAHFAKQRPAFSRGFFPALERLASRDEGRPLRFPRPASHEEGPARRFLGWTTEHHWLLPPA